MPKTEPKALKGSVIVQHDNEDGYRSKRGLVLAHCQGRRP